MPDDCNDMLKYFILQVDIQCKQRKSPGNSVGSRFYYDQSSIKRIRVSEIFSYHVQQTTW